MRWFFRQNIKRGRVFAFNQYCEPKVFDDILGIISEDLIVKGNIYDIIDVSLNYKYKLLEINLKRI